MGNNKSSSRDSILKQFDSKSLKKHTRKVSQLKHDLIGRTQTNLAKNWKPYLLKLIKTLFSSDCHAYTKLQKIFGEIVEKSDDQSNLHWITNAQQNNIVSPTYLHHLAQNKQSKVYIALDNSPQLKNIQSVQANSVGLSFMDGSSNQAFKNRSATSSKFMPMSFQQSIARSPSPTNTSTNKASQKVFTFQTNKSTRSELIRCLIKQITSTKHILKDLIDAFNCFMAINYAALLNCSMKKDTAEMDKPETANKFQECVKLLKKFVSLVTQFIMWVYGSQIQELDEILDNEGFSAEYVVESIVYQLIICDQNDSAIQKLIENMLQNQFNARVKNFRSNLKSRRCEEIDTANLEKFNISVIENEVSVFYQIIEDLQKLSDLKNPYDKFDAITKVKNSIKEALISQQKDNPRALSYLTQDFGMDNIVPIILNCIIQSQNEKLILDIEAINLLVDSDLTINSESYTVFASCVEFVENNQQSQQSSQSNSPSSLRNNLRNVAELAH